MNLRKRLLFLVPALLFAVVAVYLALGLRPGRDPTLVPSVMIDKPVPEFALSGLFDDGRGVSTADLRGKVALVNFFASWCVPCRAEHPMLTRLAREAGAEIYGIAYKDKPEESRAWLAELGNPFARVGIDPDGRTAIDFGVYGVPETYIVDRDGRIRYRHVGPLTPEVLDEELLPKLAALRS